MRIKQNKSAIIIGCLLALLAGCLGYIFISRDNMKPVAKIQELTPVQRCEENLKTVTPIGAYICTAEGKLNLKNTALQSNSAPTVPMNENEQGSQQSQTNFPKNSTTTATPHPCSTITYSDLSVDRQYVDYLDVGVTKIITEAKDGVKEWCSDANYHMIERIITPAIREVQLIGTRQPSTSMQSSGYTQAEATSLAQNNCARFADSSAYQQCVSAYMRQYGY